MNTKEEDFYLLLERFYRYNDYFIEFSFYNKEDVFSLYNTDKKTFFNVINNSIKDKIFEKIEIMNFYFLEELPQDVRESLIILIMFSNEASNNYTMKLSSLKSLESLCEFLENIPLPLRISKENLSEKNRKTINKKNYQKNSLLNKLSIFQDLYTSVLEGISYGSITIKCEDNIYVLHDCISNKYNIKRDISFDDEILCKNFLSFIYLSEIEHDNLLSIKDLYLYSKTIQLNELTEFCVKYFEEENYNIYSDFEENELIDEYIYRSKDNPSFFDEKIFENIEINDVAFMISHYKGFFSNKDLNYLIKRNFIFDDTLRDGKVIPVDYCIQFLSWFVVQKNEIELTRTVSEECLLKLFEDEFEIKCYNQNLFSISNKFKSDYKKQLEKFFGLDF